MIEAIFALRQIFTYGINWRKDRITNIGDFSVPKTSDEECLRKGLMKNLSPFFSLKNYQNLYTGEEAKVLLKRIEEFKPRLIIGYTSVLMGIASLRRKLGKVEPEYIISSGEVLDSYSRKYIEKSFNSKVLNLYATTEGGSISFECLKKNLHINSDFTYVEILDDNLDEASENERGNVVITRLHGGPTPIIRYTGLNDIASLSSDKCECGQKTPLLKTIEGRKRDAIFLPSGAIVPAATAAMPLVEILEKYGNMQVERIQFFQDRMNRVEIRLEMGEEKKNRDLLIEEIKKAYEKFFGVETEVKEKKALKIGYSYPLIISRVKHEIQENI